MDRGRRCWRRGLTTAPLCRPGAEVAPRCSLWTSVPKTLANHLGEIYGSPPVASLHSQRRLDRRGPPTPTSPLFLSVSSFVPFDLVLSCGWAAAERNSQNTQNKASGVRKYGFNTQLGLWCFASNHYSQPQTVRRCLKWNNNSAFLCIGN